MTLDAIYRWLRRGGVLVQDGAVSHVAEVDLTNDGYVIRLGPGFHAMDEEKRAQVLLHEIGHILRADLLAPQVRENAQVWNWATDAVINETLLGLHSDGITYASLRKEFPQLPELMQPAAVTYSIILSSKSSPFGSMPGDSKSGEGQGTGTSPDRKSGDRGSDGHGPSGSDQTEGQSAGPGGGLIEDRLVPSYDDPQAASEAHTRTFVDLLTSATELPEEIQSKIWGMNKHRAVDYKPPKPIAMEGLVRKLEQMIRSGHGGSSRAYRRTYRRVRYGLPMYLRVPVAEVLLAIDVSGSMTSYYPNLRYIAQALSRRHNVRIVVWDVEWQQTTPYAEWPEAGGTDVKAAYQAIKALRPDVAVIVTDGYFNWLDPDVPCPILWAVLESGKDEIRKLRPGDALVLIPED